MTNRTCFAPVGLQTKATRAHIYAADFQYLEHLFFHKLIIRRNVILLALIAFVHPSLHKPLVEATSHLGATGSKLGGLPLSYGCYNVQDVKNVDVQQE